MTGDSSWNRIKELFQAAIERAPNERQAFLEEACGSDNALQQEVESLLSSHREAGDFAERPALEALAEWTRATGEYQILSPLGAGGMGEVFRARDLALGREVAIKILPPDFAANPARLARFDREAHALASLNHPNICAIYGLTGATGTPGLVLELVEGPTLAERLAAGGLSDRPRWRQRRATVNSRLNLHDAFRIARDIARALEAAHDKGIIHRDLKPANIKITPDGVVKVLDFGLAKAIEDSTAESGSIDAGDLAANASQDGALLGTAAYMSPEQARGEPVDKRTDIWSFGCVLYEMLAGRRAAPGASVSETVAAVLESEPDWTAVPASVPPNVQRLVRRCLEKDAKRRLKDIGDACLELEDAMASPGETHASLAGRRHAPTWPRVWPSIAATLLLGAAAAVVWPRGSLQPPAPNLRRVSAELGADASLVTFQYGQGSAAVLSPDGAVLAVVAQPSEGAARQIYVRRLDELRAEPIIGTDGALNPFFSPDGRWIAFFADGKLKKVPTAGGGAVTICAVLSNRGGAWSEGGMIAFSPDRAAAALWQVPSTGGEPVPLTTLDAGETTQRWPQWLLGGKAILFTANSRPDGFVEANIVVQRLPDGPRKILVRGAYYGRYLPSGHLVYVHDGTLFAAPFDLGRLEMTGPSVPALEGASVNMPVGAAEIAFSDAGTIAYLPAPERVDYMHAPIDWMDRNGTTRPMRTTPARWLYLRFAGDGQHVAFALFDGTQHDIWMYDWSRDDLTRLTFDPAGDVVPIWTPDSRRIAFQSTRHGSVLNLYWQRVDGTGVVQRLTTSSRVQRPESWHPNGKILAFTEGLDLDIGTVPPSIMMLRVEGDEASGWRPAEPTVFLNDADDPIFSPDGRWLAYTARSSAVSGTEVFVKPFPGPGGPWQISTGGGGNPVWSAKRSELFYGAPDNRIMVTLYSVSGGSFRHDKPSVLPASRFSPRVVGRSFDLHPDGDRFALAKSAAADDKLKRRHVILVFNFLEELRRIAP